MVGTSLGGSIAGVQSALFPDNIISTVLVCPGGVNAPVKSEFVLLYENEGRTKLLPQNEEEMQELMGLLLHKKTKIPKVIMSGIIQARKPADSFFEKCKLFEIPFQNEILLIRLTSLHAFPFYAFKGIAAIILYFMDSYDFKKTFFRNTSQVTF